MQPQVIATIASGLLMVVMVAWIGKCTLKMASIAAKIPHRQMGGLFNFPKWDLFMRCKGITGRITYNLAAEKLMYKTIWLFRLSIPTAFVFVGCGLWMGATLN